MIIAFSRSIGPVPIAVFLKEKHSSTLGLPTHPLEDGSKITDHAYIEPKTLEIECADANAASAWNALVQFQEKRELFQIVTGLAYYKNVLIKELSAERDEKTSHILVCKATLNEIILVETSTTKSGDGSSEDADKKANQSKGTSKDKAKEGAKDKASGTVNRGDATTKTVPDESSKSILKRIF